MNKNRKPLSVFLNALIALFFMVCVALLLYPYISNHIMYARQYEKIVSYDNRSTKMDEETRQSYLSAANVYNKKILEDKCYQLGLVPAYNKKSIGWYTKDTKNANYTMGPTKLYYEMEPYRDAINEFGSDKKTAVLKKGFKANLDAFRPSRKESKVKFKKINRV